MEKTRINLNKNRSLLTLWGVILVITYFRILTLVPDHISWDVFGYYIYLPSVFYHSDFYLDDLSWVQDLMLKYNISDTLYQVIDGPQNKPVALFLYGMSILYAPFFGIGHLAAGVLGHPLDGLSLPYQYSLALGFLTYTFIGLWYVRKVGQLLFTDRVVALLLLCLVLGTNYFHFTAVKNLETANALFSCLAILIWHTIQWHKTHQFKNLVIISICVSLSTLIKPSELVCILIPLLWGVGSISDLQLRFQLLRSHAAQIGPAILIGFLLFIPQLHYWYVNTGHIVYDSYVNPGVGLDFLSPHILEVLFSFKKGWLLYTPLMSFALVGFYFLYQRDRRIFVPTFFYFLISFYIISSWTEWWYGAGFSIRPLVTSYAVLCIPLGASLEWISHTRKIYRSVASVGVIALIILNQFQQWQLRHFIIDPYRMNRSYYLACFGKTNVLAKTKELMDIERSFSGINAPPDFKNYKSKSLGYYDFEMDDPGRNSNYSFDSLANNGYFLMDKSTKFSPNLTTTFAGITTESHAWIQASVDVLIPDDYQGPAPLLVLTFQHKGENYEYKSYALSDVEAIKGSWTSIRASYLTPHPRSKFDSFKIYVWHRGRDSIYIDNLKAYALEPKKSWEIKSSK